MLDSMVGGGACLSGREGAGDAMKQLLPFPVSNGPCLKCGQNKGMWNTYVPARRERWAWSAEPECLEVDCPTCGYKCWTLTATP